MILILQNDDVESSWEFYIADDGILCITLFSKYRYVAKILTDQGNVSCYVLCQDGNSQDS